MTEEIIFLAQESPEGGYEARALGRSIFIQGDTLDELKAAARDAVKCHSEESRLLRCLVGEPKTHRRPPRPTPQP